MIKFMNILNIFKGKGATSDRVFLDYASTTPIDEKVKDKMLEAEDLFANPSALYTEALASKQLLTSARKRVADLLNAQPKEIYFTGGGTEGNNIALLGVFEAFKNSDSIPHFIVSAIEHPSVLEVCEEIKRRGGEISIVNAGEDGVVEPKNIISEIKDNTVLVSVMYANNEIGTIQPVKEIAKGIKEWRKKNNSRLPYFHTDACQAALYMELDVLKLGVDLLTLDGIKIYGPRASGILFVRNDTTINPLQFGGGQEKGLRSGTENVANALGMATALDIAENMREDESERLKVMRDKTIKSILEAFPNASLNGSWEKRLPNNINICFPGIDSEFVVINLDVHGIAASYSSSCMTLKEDSSSYVIENLGKADCSKSSLRFTLGRDTKEDDLEKLLSALKQVLK